MFGPCDEVQQVDLRFEPLTRRSQCVNIRNQRPGDSDALASLKRSSTNIIAIVERWRIGVGGMRDRNARQRKNRRTANRNVARRSLTAREKFIKWLTKRSTIVVTAAVTTLGGGVLGAFGSGLGQHWANSILAKGQPAGRPLKIEYVTQEPGSSDFYVLPYRLILTSSQLRHLTNLAFTSGYDSWMESRGALDPVQTVIQLGFWDNRTYPVTITDISVVHRQCGKPLAGSLFLFTDTSSGGSSNQVVPEPAVSLNLDLTSPFAESLAPPSSAADSQAQGGAAAIESNYFDGNSISIGSGQSQKLTIFSSSSNLSCKYDLAVAVSDDGKPVTEIVDDNGKPFQTAGGILNVSRYQALYVEKNKKYKRENPLTYKIPSAYLSN